MTKDAEHCRYLLWCYQVRLAEKYSLYLLDEAQNRPLHLMKESCATDHFRHHHLSQQRREQRPKMAVLDQAQDQTDPVQWSSICYKHFGRHDAQCRQFRSRTPCPCDPASSPFVVSLLGRAKSMPFVLARPRCQLPACNQYGEKRTCAGSPRQTSQYKSSSLEVPLLHLLRSNLDCCPLHPPHLQSCSVESYPSERGSKCRPIATT